VTTSAELVPVEQVDREEARAFWDAWDLTAVQCDELVQAFARHRLAAVGPSRAEPTASATELVEKVARALCATSEQWGCPIDVPVDEHHDPLAYPKALARAAISLTLEEAARVAEREAGDTAERQNRYPPVSNEWNAAQGAIRASIDIAQSLRSMALAQDRSGG
jgi:hypothetical protein